MRTELIQILLKLIELDLVSSFTVTKTTVIVRIKK